MISNYPKIGAHRRENANWGKAAANATRGRYGPWLGKLTIEESTIWDEPWYIDSWSISARYTVSHKGTVRMLDELDDLVMKRKYNKHLSRKYLREVARNIGYDVEI